MNLNACVEKGHPAGSSGRLLRRLRDRLAGYIAKGPSWQIAFLLAVLLAASPAEARSMRFIRDSETEALLKSYLRPLAEAAGMAPEDIDIHLLNDPSINAFVAGGSNIFIHTGLIEAAERPDMVSGVMAHELGHITGGHLVRMGRAAERGMWSYGITTLLGAAAAMAGGGDAAMGIMAAGNQLAQTQFAKFSRTQEQAADQAGLGFLSSAGLPAGGMLDMFGVLRRQEQMMSGLPPVYLRSHPLSSDRMAHVRHALEALPKVEVTPAQQAAYDRVRTKLYAFMHTPTESFTRYPRDDSALMRYGRSIAFYQNGDIDKALERLDALINEQPNDPYLLELKGQMLFEYGRIEDATRYYRQAQAKLPEDALIRYYLAQCLVQSGRNAEAAELLRPALVTEPDNPSLWRMLATAEGQAGHMDEAQLALAEEAYLQGRLRSAERLLDGLQSRLMPGSTLAVRHAELVEAVKNARIDHDNAR